MAQVVMRFAALLIRAHSFLSFDALDCRVIGADIRTALSLYEEEGRAYDKDFCEGAATRLAVVLPSPRGVLTFIHPQVIDQLQTEAPQPWANATEDLVQSEDCWRHEIGVMRLAVAARLIGTACRFAQG